MSKPEKDFNAKRIAGMAAGNAFALRGLKDGRAIALGTAVLTAGQIALSSNATPAMQHAANTTAQIAQAGTEPIARTTPAPSTTPARPGTRPALVAGNDLTPGG